MKGSDIRGPYVDGGAYNKSAETVFLCLKCCRQEYGGTDVMPIMYGDMAHMDTIPCDECNRYVRKSE